MSRYAESDRPEGPGTAASTAQTQDTLVASLKRRPSKKDGGPAGADPTTEPPKPPKQPRLNININTETSRSLNDLARQKETSVTEIIRRAVSVYRFFNEELSAGRKIQTVDADGGDKRDVVLM